MEGFSGLFIVLLFIAFTVLEGIGRKRRGQQKGEPGEAQVPRPREQPPSPRQSRIPTESASSQGGPPRTDPGTMTRVPRPQRAPGAGPREQGRSSEGLIPKDIWEEILGLARGEPPKPGSGQTGPDRPPRPPRREGETLEEIPPFEARSLEPLEVEEHRPSSALRVREATTAAPEKVAAPTVARMGRQPPRRRAQGGRRLKGDLLGNGSPEELRKAIILTEVLGPPLALRE